jgi:hypothetical protein
MSASSGCAAPTAPDMNGLVNELSSAEAATIVFDSSTGSELVEELPSPRNGAFTSALLEALSGKPDTEHRGAENVEERNFFVLEPVKALTDGEQHPNMLGPSSIRDFPMFTSVQ